MNKHYDNIKDLLLDTKIKEEKDGYYAFEDTVFYGEKGGMDSDEGTINGLKVIDLKWDGDVLYHKVDGALSDPIHMEVDGKVRFLHTAPQTALHILDGYYESKGLYIPSVSFDLNNQWFEVNSKDITENDIEETQEYINKAIRDDIEVEISYMNGKDYPDEEYQKFDELRIITIGDLNRQPCGTIHVSKTSMISNFVLLNHEKTSRGTRIYYTCHESTNNKLKEYNTIIKNLNKTLSCKDEEILDKVNSLSEVNKQHKKQIDDLNKTLVEYKVSDILANGSNKIEVEDEKQFRLIAQQLMNKVSEEKTYYSINGNEVLFAIISPDNKARDILEAYKEKFNVAGGGSPKMVTAKTDNVETFLEMV